MVSLAGMGGAGEIASIMVAIKGDASDLTRATNQAKGDISGLGDHAKQVGQIMATAFAGAAIAIGAFAIKSAVDVGGAYKQITRETGLTGAAADAAKNSFKNVFGSTPEDAKTTASAMSEVIKVLNLSGPALETFTTQMLALARITGTDAKANIEALNGSYNQWGVAQKDVGTKADELYVIETKTGTSVATTADLLAKAAGPAQAAGLSYEQTAIMLAQITESGVPARQAVSMLNTVIMNAEKAGKPAAAVWQDLINKFKDPAYKATKADMDLLGTSTEKFAAFARTGALDYSGLIKEVTNGKGKINEVATATQTFSEKLEIFKNKAELAFAPLGSTLIKILSDFLTAAEPVLKWLEGALKWFDQLPGPVKNTAIAIAAVTAALIILSPMLTAFSAVLGGIGGFATTAAAGLTGVAVSEGEVATASVGAEAGLVGVSSVSMVGLLGALAAVAVAVLLVKTYVDQTQETLNTLAQTSSSGTLSNYNPAGATSATQTNQSGAGTMAYPTTYQHGGIVMSPTLGILAETGPEVVVPLNQWWSSEAGKYLNNDLLTQLLAVTKDQYRDMIRIYIAAGKVNEEGLKEVGRQLDINVNEFIRANDALKKANTQRDTTNINTADTAANTASVADSSAAAASCGCGGTSAASTSYGGASTASYGGTSTGTASSCASGNCPVTAAQTSNVASGTSTTTSVPTTTTVSQPVTVSTAKGIVDYYYMTNCPGCQALKDQGWIDKIKAAGWTVNEHNIDMAGQMPTNTTLTATPAFRIAGQKVDISYLLGNQTAAAVLTNATRTTLTPQSGSLTPLPVIPDYRGTYTNQTTTKILPYLQIGTGGGGTLQQVMQAKYGSLGDAVVNYAVSLAQQGKLDEYAQDQISLFGFSWNNPLGGTHKTGNLRELTPFEIGTARTLNLTAAEVAAGGRIDCSGGSCKVVYDTNKAQLKELDYSKAENVTLSGIYKSAIDNVKLYGDTNAQFKAANVQQSTANNFLKQLNLHLDQFGNILTESGILIAKANEIVTETIIAQRAQIVAIQAQISAMEASYAASNWTANIPTGVQQGANPVYTVPGTSLSYTTPAAQGAVYIPPSGKAAAGLAAQHGYNGLITSPTIGLFGEGGPEWLTITPLSSSGGTKSVGPRYTIIQHVDGALDAKEIAKEVTKALRRADLLGGGGYR